MNRRNFLRCCASALTGAALGFIRLPKVLALETPSRPSRMALIIDDIGYSLPGAARFLDLNVPLTFAVLPRLAYTRDLAVEIHDVGHEIMLHQPMEPFDPQLDPGPGALFVGDRKERIFRTVEENYLEVPFATGVNNHMGSRFTASRPEIDLALKAVRRRNLFFVDSLTTRYSRAYSTARLFHMVAGCNDIFLDSIPEEGAILRQLYHLRSISMKYGRAIGIGHPYPETARAIRRFVREASFQEVEMVYISDVLPA